MSSLSPDVAVKQPNVKWPLSSYRWELRTKIARVSLDDIAWALDIESSKTADVEGSKVYDLYHAGKLAAIREYNLNDVRVTRKVYERIVGCFGR